MLFVIVIGDDLKELIVVRGIVDVLDWAGPSPLASLNGHARGGLVEPCVLCREMVVERPNSSECWGSAALLQNSDRRGFTS